MIGDKIREKRIKLGLTQKELAEKIEVGKTTIGNWETGVSAPDEEKIIKLMLALDCDANYLFADYDTTKEKEPSPNDNGEKLKVFISEIVDDLSVEQIKSLIDYVNYLIWKEEQEF